MTNILREHALKNVWAESVQDTQYRIRPTRISPKGGFFKAGNVLWESIPMPRAGDPTDKTSYHLYSLGQLPAWLFKLQLSVGRWYRLDEFVNINNTVVNVYVDNGASVPRSIAYLYQNFDQNFILAIARTNIDFGSEDKQNSYGETVTIPYTLDRHGINVRFYTNAILQSEEWREQAVDPLHTLRDVSVKIETQSDYFHFMNQCTAIENEYMDNSEEVAVQQGLGLFYIDGFVVSRPDGYSDSYIGKVMSFQYDATIREIEYFRIDEVTSFKSDKDSRLNKYLLVSKNNYGRIDYFDDLDFYVIYRYNGKIRGVAIDGFEADAIRQVTHNAYAINTNKVLALSNAHQFLNNIMLLELMVVYRNGGMRHGLGFQANRIEDLYHLPRSEVIEAMSLVESNVEFWRAPDLENSAYIDVMSSKANQITNERIEEAYGYNAIGKNIHKSIYKVIDGKVRLDPAFGISTDLFKPLPNLVASKRCFFWYNQDGELLGYSTDQTTNLSITAPNEYSSAVYVEAFIGNLRTGLDSNGSRRDREYVYDHDYGYFGHRNYVCNIVGAGIDNNWVDVTNGPYASYFPAENGNPPYIKWNYTLLNQTNLYPMTRFANVISLRSFTITATSLVNALTVQLSVLDNGVLNPLGAAPAHVDVFMNNKPLIENLDYYYSNGGQLTITRQVQEGQTANILVRFYGYGDPITNESFKPRDFGFVKNGILSHNNVFNVTHDRCIRVNVGGQLRTADDVSFAEDTPMDLHLDGKPYSVEDYQPLIEPYTSRKTVDFQMESMGIDQIVSDYLTMRLPEPSPNNQYIQGELWEVYSPIMSTFIQLMSKNMLPDYILQIWTNDAMVFSNTAAIVEMYRSADPILRGFDPEYVLVRPYPFKTLVEVSSLQYATLERINRLHLHSVIDLTDYVTIRAGS